MDNLFEIIVPIIFAAIYFFGNMLSGKSGDKSAPDPRKEDPDAVERQRRIQEEIRRKIMERRNAAEGQGAAGHASESPTDLQLRERREAVERRRAEREQQKQARTATSESRIPDPASRIPHPATDDIYSNQMEDRLQKIEATKRHAAKLQKEAAASREKLKPTDDSTAARLRGRSREARRPVRSTLRDPAAARAAFIYGEVLGQPVSMKKTPTVPGLS